MRYTHGQETASAMVACAKLESKKVMSKTKTSHAALDIYQTLTPPSKSVAARKIILDGTGQVYVFSSAESPVPADVAIDIEFRDMDDFIRRGRGTILAYHEKFLGCEAPKKQDAETSAFMTWAWMVKNGKPILDQRNAEGEKVRKSTIGESLYMRGEVSETGSIKTPQAKVCYDLFCRCIGSSSSVTEADLRKFVEAHGAELKTKQDPWRIFQYYRPNLIASKHIRRS